MPSDLGTFEPLWTVDDVSAFLGIPVHTLYQWRTNRKGPPARRVGKHLRYRPDDVRTWFDALDQDVA
ncbi:MAG TPA: helix-turn-helix domain-containing protein [Pseudonocardiaceae bacterium]|nr:helix-turn-helix domain-containing protein [Pseudonocardiaceae bacterium]